MVKHGAAAKKSVDVAYVGRGMGRSSCGASIQRVIHSMS
ncbi:hypothetical protein B0G77_5619 [Paraburkholderia sp. BL10I2N1]|nr:hypothetical protein B0G77_5619 [Paraburkholderia sp. BL10I2N1]